MPPGDGKIDPIRKSARRPAGCFSCNKKMAAPQSVQVWLTANSTADTCFRECLAQSEYGTCENNCRSAMISALKTISYVEGTETDGDVECPVDFSDVLTGGLCKLGALCIAGENKIAKVCALGGEKAEVPEVPQLCNSDCTISQAYVPGKPKIPAHPVWTVYSGPGSWK